MIHGSFASSFRYAAAAVSFAIYSMVLSAAPRGNFESMQKGGPPQPPPNIPAYAGNIILGRPTSHSITASVMLNSPAKARIAYGRNESLTSTTALLDLNPGAPIEVVLDGLQPDTTYQYRLVDFKSGAPIYPKQGSASFHTQRPAGSEFTFAIQADSHLDDSCLPELYIQTLINEQMAHPDFILDLGDTFMTEKHESRQNALQQYLAQRYYLGSIAHSAPLFLVVGNHDGEEIRRRAPDGSDALAVWSCLQRKRYFPNPQPNGFYSGNSTINPSAGALQDYYAWEWGDALFVVLDPYWSTPALQGGRGQNERRGQNGRRAQNGGRGEKQNARRARQDASAAKQPATANSADGAQSWNTTLGKTQYDWLARTLRASKAKYKFIFIHQLVGGLDRNGRGGAEAAAFYEWGGRDPIGEYTFPLHRPGWEKPIHELLKETGVTIVFHGHDHFFAHQEKDGIIYQLVPQPAHRNNRTHQAAEYGYVSGDFLPNSGYLRVHASPGGVDVSYMRTRLSSPQGHGEPLGEEAFHYHAPASPSPKSLQTTK